MVYEGTKKFLCVRCGMIGKRHDFLETQQAICSNCEGVIGQEATEAMKLVADKKAIPDRLMYLYKSKQLSLDN
jgi:hypothetical protein